MTATTAKVVHEARALQTRTSTRSTSTTSSTSTATQVPSRVGGFPLTGAPPFILALLAVGILAVGIIIFFGSRRRAAAQRRHLALALAPPLVDAPPPRLWDFWSPARGELHRGRWKDIQPLSATVWDEVQPEPSVQPTALHHDSVLPHRDPILAAAFSHLRRRYLRPRLEEDLPIESAKSAAPTARVVRLQIAVTIAMPAFDLSADEKLDYVIGLHEIPWEED